VEHVAGSDQNDNVILYFRVQHQAWQKVEVTTITGQKIASPLTSWQSRVGGINYEHLAGVNSNGDLIVFTWSPGLNWRAVNISEKTAQNG
jgi:hypothetical protein